MCLSLLGLCLFEAVRQRRVAAECTLGVAPLPKWHGKCYYLLFVWLA